MSAEAVEVQSQAAAPTLHSRLSSILSAPSEAPDAGTPSPSADAKRVQSRSASEASDEDAEGVTAESTVPEGDTEDREAAADGVESDDAQSEERQFSNLTELLEAAGLDTDKGFDLELPVKLDGKEGTAKLRDLVKSYQLDGYHHQKLEAVNADRKALEADRGKLQQERHETLAKLSAAAQVAETMIKGRFAHVDWQRLANEDPATYAQTVQEFNAQNDQYQMVARQLNVERTQFEAQQQALYQAHLDEQKKLVEAAFPEWKNESKRQQDKATFAQTLKDLGAPEGAFESLTDAWQVQAVKEVAAYRALMKSKPATLNKVKAAPKLLKPGSPQSKASVDAIRSKQSRDTYRKTGKTSDGVAVLRSLLG